jgi:pimeloyl-ACP methyl ester carboxylesterase
MKSSVEIDFYEGGEGSPLVLLHGIGGSWRAWRPVIPILEQKHRIFAPTLPGHLGGPAWPADQEPTVDGIAGVLVDQLASRGIRRPHVAGNSLGGWIALELARRGLVASVTALSPAGAWRSVDEYRAVARPFRTTYGLMPVLIAAARPFLRFAAVRRSLNKQAMEHGERVPADEMLSAMRAFGGAQILPRLLMSMERLGPMKPVALGDIPTTIAWGECDRVIPFASYGAPMIAAAPGADAATLTGCGHVPMYDDPSQVADVILAATSKAASRSV